MEKAKQAAADAKAKVEAAVAKPPREWETGICGCFEDFGGCCMGMWCPCVVSYQLAPEADSSGILCCLGSLTLFSGGSLPLFLISGCCLRQNYREAKNIQGGAVDDFLCGGVCHNLNLCQMAREVSGAGDSGVARMER